MKWRSVAATASLLALAGLFLVSRSKISPLSPESPSSQNTARPAKAASDEPASAPVVAAVETVAPPSTSRGAGTAPPPPPAAGIKLKTSPGGLDFTNLPPDIVLENLRGAVRRYGSMMGGNPVGTNPEITRALNGNNPRQARFLDPDAGLRINEKGELIDPWGTPFFFHQLSGTQMEIHSAGPDKIMWSADDLVTK